MRPEQESDAAIAGGLEFISIVEGQNDGNQEPVFHV